MNIIENLEKARIIPVIILENPDDTIPLCEALQQGGITVGEITFRTAAAAQALTIARERMPEFIFGAGTITTERDLTECIKAGAHFAVAPGCNPRIVRSSQERNLPFFPGVCTPTDIELALELGCSVLKFFPADAIGGTRMLKAIYAPYGHRGIRFIPTGGISEANLKEYLSLPGVLAIGGSWLVEKTLIKEKNWKRITQLTKDALFIVEEFQK